MFKDAGCGQVYFEGTAYAVPQGARSSFAIAGLGTPKGIKKATVGMKCHSNSCTIGRIDGTITTINFDAPRARQLGQGSCSVSIHDMFISRPCPSGGCIYTDDGYVLGLIIYGDAGGVNNTRCSAYNPFFIMREYFYCTI